MRQAMHQPFNMTQVISFGLVTALLSLFQPIPSASAQQLTGPVSQGTIGAGTQKKYAQTSTRKPHQLIRRPQNTPVASVEPSPSGSPPLNSLPTPPPSLQSDTTQPKEPSSFNKSVGAALPLATMSVAPSPATAKSSIAAGTTPTGTIPVAAASAGNASTSGNGSTGGRSMSRLAAEMPGLAQLISPPSAPPVISINPAIGVSPTSLSFTVQQGSGNPTTQTLSISNTGSGTLSWNANTSATWLSLSSASGTGAGTVTLSVATGSLTTGSYSGTVIFSATGASSVTVPVTFTVTATPVPPAIGASPTSFAFTATQGGSNPANQTLSISNTGGGSLAWSANDDAPWLTLSPASGNSTGTITMTATTGTLTVGAYTGTITLTATGAPNKTVPITFTVTAAPVPPAIGASPTSLAFTATQGGSNPANQTLSISNTGGGSLTWSASDNATWLTLSTASGTGNGTVTLAAATGTLTAATYSGTITLTATGASNRTIPVTFTVTAPPASTIGLSPVSLSFTATQGAANPAAKTISVTNPGNGTLTWSVSGNATWLTLNPASGTTTTETDPITASINTTGMAAGTYNASIAISGTGATNTPQTIPVVLTITAPAISSATLSWNANTESDLAGYKVYRRVASSTSYGAPIATLQGSATTYTASGQQSGSTYFFVVTSYDSAGNESTFSNEVSRAF